MERRKFLSASIAMSAAAIAGEAQPAPAREYYQLRRYRLLAGPQARTAASYLSGALLPALGRMSMGPVGAFQLDYGPETPAYYLLIPSSSLAALVELDARLGQDAEFLKAAAPFWNGSAASPAFQQVESWILGAFEGWPKLVPPPAGDKRIFQLRTYESPSYADHVLKVEQINAAADIFNSVGLHPMFFGDTLVGSGMPCLTYMLSLGSLAELDPKWSAFRNDPAWKKLSVNPRYADTLTKIGNLLLSPLAGSQI